MLIKIICFAVILSSWSVNYRVQADIPGVIEGFEEMLKFWFPDDADFNESCVSEGCPALKNFTICPNQINITVLLAVLDIAKDCMREPICGIVISERPTLGLTTTTDEWLPDMGIVGTATSSPDTGFLHNISQIQFEFQPNHNQTQGLPIQLTMLISDLRMIGGFQLALSLSKTMPSILGQSLSVTIPQVKYDIELEFVSTVSINHSATHSNFDLKLLNPIIKAHPMFCGLDMPKGFPSILTMFTTMTQVIIEKSSWAVRQASILVKYLQSVLHIVSSRC